jgi:hypothetical protein
VNFHHTYRPWLTHGAEDCDGKFKSRTTLSHALIEADLADQPDNHTLNQESFAYASRSADRGKPRTGADDVAASLLRSLKAS